MTVPTTKDDELEMAQVTAASNAMTGEAGEHHEHHVHDANHPHQHQHHHHHGQRRSGRGSFRSTEFTMEDDAVLEMAVAAAAAAAAEKSMEMTDVHDVTAATADEERMLAVGVVVPKKTTAAAAAEAAADGEVSCTSSSTTAVTACTTIQETLANWMMTTVIGILVVGYWRGTWTLLDLWTCGQPETSSLVGGDVFCFAYDFTAPDRIRSGVITYVISLVVLAAGIAMVWAGLWTPPPSPTPSATEENNNGNKKRTTTMTFGTRHVSYPRAAMRIVICYTLGFGTVLQWHGIWYSIDYFFIPQNMAQSFGWGTFLGVFGCFFLLAGNSMLAPPVIILRDGPSAHGKPPPIAVTLLSSYYALSLPGTEQAPKSSVWLLLLDIFWSYFCTPFMVLMYWSSFWQLQDLYFYGFTPDIQDVYISVFYSALIAMAAMLLGSDDVFYFVNMDQSPRIVKEIVSRLRTLVLAIGVLSFWRVVWYFWDLFLGGTTFWSCWLSHWLGIVGLTCLGCLSCITAPPSQLGVDVIPHPHAASEPLFHYLPVPANSLYFMGIARQASPIVVDMDNTEVTFPGGGSKRSMKAVPEGNEKSVEF